MEKFHVKPRAWPNLDKALGMNSRYSVSIPGIHVYSYQFSISKVNSTSQLPLYCIINIYNNQKSSFMRLNLYTKFSEKTKTIKLY